MVVTLVMWRNDKSKILEPNLHGANLLQFKHLPNVLGRVGAFLELGSNGPKHMIQHIVQHAECQLMLVDDD